MNLRKLTYSFGNFPIGLILESFGTYVIFFYVDVLGLKPQLVSFAFIIHGIIFAILNPLIGYISDKTHTRFGRRKPYIAVGILPLAIAFYLIWSPFVPKGYLSIYFLSIIIVFDLFYVMVALNLAALFPEMFPTLSERAQVSALRQTFGILGTLVGVALPPLIYSVYGWSFMGHIFSLIIIFGFIIALYGSHESEKTYVTSISIVSAIKYTFKNVSFLWYMVGGFFVKFVLTVLPAGIPFFTKYVLKLPSTDTSIILGSIFIAAIPMMFFWSSITKKIGSRNAIIFSIFLLFIIFPWFFIVHNFLDTLLVSVIFGFALAGVVMLLDVMLAEVIDEDTKNTGMKREGIYTGVFWLIIRLGYSLQGIVIGTILQLSGYVPNVLEQPSSAILGIRFLISGVPIIALLISLISFYFYPIGRKKKRA